MGVFDTPDLPPLHKDKPFENANPQNWNWPERIRGRWVLAVEPWQNFYKKWREATDCTSLMGPSPSLSLSPLNINDLPDVPNTLYVRRFYEELFKLVWKSAFSREKGHLIIGQPGIGKTTFLPYLLVRLIQQKQYVLFTLDGVSLYLFYQDQVYYGHIQDFTLTLPRRTREGIFIWSLFDIKARREPAGLLLCPQCLPVQTASPDSNRYRRWTKQKSAKAPRIVIIPVWSHDELVRGLRYQKHYQPLLDALANAYPEASSSPPYPIQELQSLSPGISRLFARYDFDPVTMSVIGLVLPVASPSENALAWLLKTAIEHFGFVARDVFAAVFDFQTVELLRDEAFRVGFSNLEATVTTLVNRSHANNAPYHVICIHPPDDDDTTSFQLKWKSDWISTRVAERLHFTEDTEIRQMISYFQNLGPMTKALAGVFTAEFTRRSLTSAGSE